MIKLPAPIAAYIAIGNRGDMKALAECFAENAVVRDEGRTIKGLIAVKQWMAETKRKYQHTIEPIAFAEEDSRDHCHQPSSPGIFPAVRSSSNLSSRSTPTRSRHSRSAHETGAIAADAVFVMTVSRLHFAHLPTPIESLPRLSKTLGGPRLLIKRDDQTGLAFGGNKTRKLEFLVAEARDWGAKTLITGGALQSNHCRQTAAAAARFGFECILVLTGDKPEQPSANLLLDQLFGAQVVYAADRKDRDRILQQTFDHAAEKGMKPYLVPYGGSSPTGALGYAFAVKEFMEQNVSRGLDRVCHILRRDARGTRAGSAGVWI